MTALPASSPTRVLLVEDADADARAVESVLREYRFDVRRALRLSEALAALRSEHFDVVLADLGLPDSAGLATLDMLRNHAAAIPIVIMTGHDDESTAVRAVAAGAQDYLIKGSTEATTLVRSLRHAVERGHGRDAIRIGEAHLRNILEGALDAVVSMNQDGRIVQWNRSAEEIFGWPSAEVLGMPLVELIVPGRFREAHQRGVRTFLETGDAPFLGIRTEWTALRRDGSEFPAEVRITAEAEPAGMTFTAFISDITERRRAEEERNASEARLRALVEHTSDLIYLASSDGTIRYVSPVVQRMLGYAPEELLGRRLLDFVHADDSEYVTERFRTPSGQSSIRVFAEFRFRHKDGTWRNLEVLRVNRLFDPAVRAIVGTVRDVTGQRQVQQALDGLRRRYESILDSITDGVYGVDLAGNIVFENPAAAAMLGWPPGALIGRSAHQTLQPLRADGSPRPEAECPLHGTLADGGVRFSDQDVFWCREGKEIRVELTTAPMLDEQGRIAGAVMTFRDVSTRKRMEQQLEQATRADSLGRVSASVAHELNNLLMGLKPFAEVLNRRAQGDPAIEKPARHVLNIVRRGQRLTDEILRFINPAEPRMEPVDLAALLRELSEEARGILAGRRLELELPAALIVRADGDQLSQVLLNLVTNARNATAADGVVTIGAAPASSIAFLREHLPAPADFAALYVRDNGSGIAAEARERMFEPFFTTRKNGGTGLGLAVASRIAAAHGGRILIESEAGQGAAFYVLLRV
ncbi:MAG TPA: PAS domain S-box protein [Thermoanaerobaculia bacterium]|nr:PAS domain S-box protein [Thermoanaerobaculia bacterium]